MAIGYFDGASQDGGYRCVAGALLISPILGNYSVKWNCGFGTNTRAELLALWSILHLANSMGIDAIQIVGDSRIIVDWFREFTFGNFGADSLDGAYYAVKDSFFSGQHSACLQRTQRND